MENRERLPNRRATQSFEFTYHDLPWVLNVGRYPDGRLAEVFAQCSKTTSEVAQMARDASILVSIALQHGVPVETMQSAVTRLGDGTAASVAGRILDELCGVTGEDEVGERDG